MSLVELRDYRDIKLAKALIQKYHVQGVPYGGGFARSHRFFVLERDGYWCAIAWIHEPTPFRFIFERFKLDQSQSYFLRRIVSVCPGHHAVELLKLLCQKLKNEGKELLVTLGLPNHSNALYKLAGFKEVGKCVRSGHPVFVFYLQES